MQTERTHPVKLIGYIRVSRVAGRNGDEFISPDVQRQAITTHAKANGHKIVKWAQDRDESGKTLERPGFKEALALVKDGKGEGICAAKLDRITRSVADLGRLIDQASEEGWNPIATDLGLAFTTPNGQLVANVLSSVAEWYRGQTRAGFEDAQARFVENGGHISPRVPFGYCRNGDRRLMRDPETAPHVREMFTDRVSAVEWHGANRRRDASHPCATTSALSSVALSIALHAAAG
jgi:DNA invertase Pin-like site-specific DNA recombinase